MSPTDNPPAARPPTMAGLQNEHAALVASVGLDLLAPANLDRIQAFVGRVTAAGTALDHRDDRTSAQGLINFWTARVSAAARAARGEGEPRAAPAFGEALLADFSSETLRAAERAADAWLARAGADLARRILLRLVRLQPEGPTFVAIPTVRAALYDLDEPDRVGEVVRELEAAGVVRVTPGDSPDMDRVALRSPEFLNTWTTLTGWLADRLRFRTAATAWDQAGRPAAQLASDDATDGGPRLEEARRYHDRNKVERDYVNESVYRQARKLERAESDRRAKLWWRGLAAVAALGWLGTAAGWFLVASKMSEVRQLNLVLGKSNDDLKVANDDLTRAIKARAEADEARVTAEGERTAAQNRLAAQNRARVRWMAAMQLSRALGEVASSRTRPERELAAKRLELVIDQLEGTGAIDLPPESRGVLNEVNKMAKTWDAPDDAQNDLARRVLVICRRMRNEALGDPDMNAFAVVVRQVPYQVVRESTDTILKRLRAREPADHIAPFVREFWTLYWGEMVMFERPPVETAMYAFGRALRAISDKQKDAISNDDLSKAMKGLAENPAKLTQLAKELRVRGGGSDVLNAVVQDAQKPKYTDADLRALADAHAELVRALEGELRESSIELRPAAAPLKR
jgi:hypothetical protein